MNIIIGQAGMVAGIEEQVEIFAVNHFENFFVELNAVGIFATDTDIFLASVIAEVTKAAGSVLQIFLRLIQARAEN